MTKKEAESKLEYMETPDELKSRGLRRIKRRHYTGPPELLPRDTASKELLDKIEIEKRRREKLAA